MISVDVVVNVEDILYDGFEVWLEIEMV